MSNPSSGAGRYAPSPTGALHLGNLRTALASYLSARSRGMRYLLRIEDIDRNRCKAEFEDHQLADLNALGIDWDAEPLRQSERGSIYDESLDRLKERRLVYPCFCSRKDIQLALSAPHVGEGTGYPGTCSILTSSESASRIKAGEQHCWRLRVDQAPKVFIDGFHGDVSIDLSCDGGDFVIKRADGFHSYQLVCAVDDALSGVSEVLRGDDLLDSGARQAYLLHCLGLPIPRYIHIPLMNATDGNRLAKRVGSEDLSGFLSRGYTVEQIRGYLAWSLGLCERGEVLTMQRLTERWALKRVPREAFIFNDEDIS